MSGISSSSRCVPQNKPLQPAAFVIVPAAAKTFGYTPACTDRMQTAAGTLTKENPGADTASQKAVRDGVVGVSFQQFLRSRKKQSTCQWQVQHHSRHQTRLYKARKTLYRQLKHLELTRRVCFRRCHEGTPGCHTYRRYHLRILQSPSFPHRFCLAN